VHAPAVIGPGCTIDPSATVTGRSVLGAGVALGPGAYVDGSVLLDGATVGAHSRVVRSIVGPGARIAERCRLEQAAMVGEGVRLGARNTLSAGVRVFPGVELPDAAIAF
jgi:mannose-1-phosphate guanylyltransferase